MYMKRNFFLLLIFNGLLTFLSFSQEKTELKYKTLFDDPDLEMLNLNIGLFNTNINNYNFSLNSGVGCSLFYKKMFARINYDINYANNIQKRNKDVWRTTFVTSGEPRFMSDLEVLMTIPLYSNSPSKNQSIRFKSDSKNGIEKQKVRVPVKKLQILSLDLGINAGKTYYDFGESSIHVLNLDKVEVETLETTYNFTTVYEYRTVNPGISIIRTHKFQGDFDEYGKKTSQKFSRFYANFIFLVSSNLANVSFSEPLSQSGSKKHVGDEYDLQNSVKMERTGFCIGYERLPRENLGVSTGIEFGVNPGPVASYSSKSFGYLHNAYLKLKVNISIDLLKKNKSIDS